MPQARGVLVDAIQDQVPVLSSLVLNFTPTGTHLLPCTQAVIQAMCETFRDWWNLSPELTLSVSRMQAELKLQAARRPIIAIQVRGDTGTPLPQLHVPLLQGCTLTSVLPHFHTSFLTSFLTHLLTYLPPGEGRRQAGGAPAQH